jgi:SpoVK/Ycf46/Vps4 family AAA+-type ATPase
MYALGYADIPLPGREGRRKMFDLNLRELKVGEGVDWERVLELTQGCSGADICNICRDAAYMPMRRKLAQVGGITKISELSQNELLNESIAETDILESARKIRPSVGSDDLKRYSDWMK